MTPSERRQMMLAGPIVPTILTLATPNVLNVAMQSLVSITDGYFIGQLGVVDLAALALVFPTQMTLGMMSAGAMGGGISSSVARALGSGNKAAAEAAAAHALAIAIGMAALFGILFVGFGRQIYGALGGSGAALDRAEAFATILFSGCVAHWVANSMASVLRGTGDMKTPGLALVATAAIQIPLTGALTLGWFGLPALGIRGPAVAAVIAFAIAALWMLSKLIGPKAPLRLRWPVDGFRWRAFRDILKVGLIACLVVILTNGTVLVVTGLIGREGDAAIAGYGIGSRLEYMLIPISFGIGATLTALVGTNIGAKQYARAQRTGAGRAPSWPARSPPPSASSWRSGRTCGSACSPPIQPRSPRAATISALSARPTASSASPWRSTSPRRAPARWSGRSPPTSPASPSRAAAALLALDHFGWGISGLYTCVAVGIVAFSAVLAFSTTRRAWTG